MLSNAIMLYLLLVCLYFSVVDAFTINSRNNVCRGLDDYATIGFNKNCFYNPDVDSDPKEIANRYGFAFESYKVTTEDGYILDLFRIPRNFTDKTKNRQPVILQHGIMSWGIRWMHLGNKSLPFFLVNNGYDVWISNSRGHGTTEHNNSAITPKEYWNFSFHEVGIYDLPAYISFISEITRRDGDIIYIGHSMGTTDSFVYSSLRKEHAEENLKGIIALAPVAYIKTISPIYQLFLPFLNQIQDISENIGIYGIGQLDAFSNMCNNYPTIILCRIGYELFGGIEEEQLQLERFPLSTSNSLTGTSIKTLIHYLQMIKNNGRFQWYDYGPSLNLDLYQSIEPPEYPVDKICIPVHLFYGTKDAIVLKEGVYFLYEKLTSPKSIHEFKLGHNDFWDGKNVDKLYSTILDVMKNI